MFSKLLKSAARKSLLEIFMDDSRQKYYLRELATKINYSPGSLQRELTSLIDDGILLAERMGNLRFFFLNTKSPLIKELKHYIQSHKNDAPAPKKEPTPKKPKPKPVLVQRPMERPTPIKAEIKEEIKAPTHQPTTQPAVAPTQPTIQPAIQKPPVSPPYEPSFYKPNLAKPIFSKPDLTPPPAQDIHEFDYSEPKFEAVESEPSTDRHLSYQPEFTPEPAPAPKKDDNPGDITLHIE